MYICLRRLIKGAAYCGAVASLFASAVCCLFCLFLFIPLMPFIFIPCWIFGAIIAWITSDRGKKLIDYACIWSVVVFSVICGLFFFLLIYPEEIIKASFWSTVSLCIFFGCSYGAKTVSRNKLNLHKNK